MYRYTMVDGRLPLPLVVISWWMSSGMVGRASSDEMRSSRSEKTREVLVFGIGSPKRYSFYSSMEVSS
jgi:hypothetical protein